MTSIEVARRVVNEKSAYLFREKADGSYDAKLFFAGSKRGWTCLDLFSASALVQVYDAVNEQNKEKLLSLPLAKAVRLAFKCIK